MIMHNLEFLRIGPRRELKRSLENHWTGRIIRAGRLLKIVVVDHVVIGIGNHTSCAN